MNSQSVFAREEALRRVDNDRELLRELVGMFLAEFAKNISSLRSAQANGDEKTFTRIAHSIKGAAANIGANITAGVASRLEHTPLTAGAPAIERITLELETAFAAFQAAYERSSAADFSS